MGVPASTRRLRFGLFEADLSNRELYKGGRPVHLQDQPFQLLVMLLERPGEVVTREDLRRALWPADTFVDFDEGLNTAIKKLRSGLGDSPDNPAFIQTVPRRGYRFLAPVTAVEGAVTNTAPDIRSSDDPARGVTDLRAFVTVSPVGVRESVKPSTVTLRGWKVPVAVLGAMLSAALLILTVRLLSPSPLVRVTGFVQITNDGWPKTTGRLPIQGIFSDQQRLYLQEIRNNLFAVSQVSIGGGEVAPLLSPFPNTTVFDISPDRTKLLVGSGSGQGLTLWILPLPAGLPQRLGNLSGHSAVWSRDGKEIFFTNDHDLYVANSDGTEAKKLLSLQGYPFWIRVSNDGRRLRFSVFDARSDSLSLWQIASNGSGLRRLFGGWHDPPQECCGTWTPDGKYYVFQTYPRSGPRDLWVAPEERYGSREPAKPVQLTKGPLEFFAPQPSADGKKLFALGLLRRSELVRNTPSQGFVPFLGGLDAAGVSFSPDRKWIAFTATADSTLWRSRIDGSDRLQLTFPPMEVIAPRWSPDGSQIVFMGQMPGKQKRALLISPQGGVPRELLPRAFMSADASWSPDGKALVLGIQDSEGDKPGIFILNLQSKTRSLLPASEQLFSPRWSPDGKYIAALTQDEQTLMLFDRSTRRWKELAHMWIGYPSWSHDSRYLYFDTLGEDPCFYRVRISDRKQERLVSLKDTRRLWTAWEPWSGLAPDDSLLIQRDISTQEIYALDWALP